MKIWLFFVVLFNIAQIEAQQLRVLYFNDAHELEAVEFNKQQVGGIAKLSHKIKERRNDNTIVLFGGDLAGGTLGGRIFKGSVMVKAFNEIGIDVANPGQHEFDYGIENFIQLKNNSQFPWISSNLIYPEDSSLFLPFQILLRKNYRIGVIGLTDKIETSKPGLAIRSLDRVSEARRIINDNPKVDFWIALTQMSIDKNEHLHLDIPEIDLILTEETAHDRTQVIWHEQTPIIAASGNAGDLVEVNINGDVKTLTIHPLRKNSVEDKTMKAWISDSLQIMEHTLSHKIGYAKNAFLKKETHFGERAIGNLVADAFRAYYNADIGIIHGGGIREGIPRGEITLKHIYAILPFENHLMLTELTGVEIKEILNIAIQRMMPQVSGLKLIIATKENKPFIQNVLFRNQPIEDYTKYTASLPSYIADGGGNYNKINKNKILKNNILDADALIWYLQKNQKVEAVLEGRITE